MRARAERSASTPLPGMWREFDAVEYRLAGRPAPAREWAYTPFYDTALYKGQPTPAFANSRLLSRGVAHHKVSAARLAGLGATR